MNEYLKNIIWSKNDIPKGIQSYLKNMRIVSLLIVALVVSGLAAYLTTPQTVAPEIKLTMIVASAALPGATPEDVETLLTIPIENELKGVDGIDKIESRASDGFTSIVMTFDRGVDKNKALSDVESALNSVGDLPEDATDPKSEAVDFEDYPIVQWAFTSKSDSDTSLSAQMQKLIDELESNQTIDRVESAGQSKREVQILVIPEQINALNLQIDVIRNAIKSALATLPSGTVGGEGIERSLSLDTSIQKVDDLRQLPIDLDGRVMALGEIAVIAEKPVPGNVPAYIGDKQDIRKSITLNVYGASGVDLSETAKASQDIVGKFIKESEGQITLYEIANVNNDLIKQFNDLMRNLSVTIMLVFVTLTLFVGQRQALIASMSIPLIYAIAFVAMKMTDISVNFLSLFALMLSLGLLVDVTIVIISAMTTYKKEGSFDAHTTGMLVFRDFFVTLIATTLTTVWAFVPLLMAGGIIGEYIKPLPIVVSAVLGASVFVGFFVILPFMIWVFDFNIPKRVSLFFIGLSFIVIIVVIWKFLKLSPILAIFGAILSMTIIYSGIILYKNFRKRKQGQEGLNKKEGKSIVNISILQEKYRNSLDYVLRSRSLSWKVIAIVTVFFVFAVSLVVGGFVKNEFFPGADSEYFYISLELPEGKNATDTEKFSKEMLPQIVSVDGIEYGTLQIGYEVGADGTVSSVGENKALFTIKAPLKDDGGRGSSVVAEDVRNLEVVKNNTQGKISILELAGGPPAGADVTIVFSGDDIETLTDLARELEGRIKNLPVENVNVAPESAAAAIVFKPDDYQLSEEGLSNFQISNELRLLTNGSVLAEDIEFDDLEQERDIVLRVNDEDASLLDLGKVRISGNNGKTFPLDSLGKIVLKENISEIKREDYERTVTLTASIKGEANAVELNKQIGEIVDNQMSLPIGYNWRSGGANEQNNDSVASIIQGMGLAAILIFLTLIIILNSYRKAVIVLLTIPLAISGVFVMFGIFGITLSFPALIGVLALFGIVVNNAIIIISQINANRKSGMNFHASVVEGASSRLEPILLSSLTTIVGLTPITLSDPLWQGLGGAIIAGLSFSGIIMLFFIPTVYYKMMRDEYDGSVKMVDISQG